MNSWVARCMVTVGRFRPIGLVYQMSTGSQIPTHGHGVGKGGGAGGSVRESGGAFGEREAAQEDWYFWKLTTEQLDHLHDHHIDEIHYLENKVKEHEEAVKRQKKKLSDLKKLCHRE